MSCITFTVAEEKTGWFVGGGDSPIGPFLSKLRAIELATGMVASLQGFGEEARVVLEDHRANPPPPVRPALLRMD